MFINVILTTVALNEVSIPNREGCSLNLGSVSDLCSNLGGRRVANPCWVTHIHPYSFNSLCQRDRGIKLYCDRTHSPSRYLSYNLVYASFSLSLPLFPFFFFLVISVASICSFHLPRLSPGPLIYTAPTAPLGQTGLWRHSLCALKGHCVHTDMKRRTETENGF